MIADGTTDISGQEQFAICIQYTNEKIETVNSFLGYYKAPDSSGSTLANVIRDVLIRNNLPLSKVIGYSFDTASNMSRRYQVVQARLAEDCPYALYVPCSNHSLDLVSQEVSRDINSVAEAIVFVKDVANIIRESTKRRGLHESLFDI